MKRSILFFIFIVLIGNSAFAGFLSGNSSPYVNKIGAYALKVSTSILMVGTPFSSICLAGKYCYDENLDISAKYGVGTIDYSTVTGTKLTNDPQVSSFGFGYILSGSREAEYSAFVAEYEAVLWSINKKSNISNEIMIGIEYSTLTSDLIRTRYRLALDNFNAGFESEEKLGTSVKYSLSTEIDYSFSKNLKGSFEAGIYFGDPIGGIIALFGLGFGFNS